MEGVATSLIHSFSCFQDAEQYVTDDTAEILDESIRKYEKVG